MECAPSLSRRRRAEWIEKEWSQFGYGDTPGLGTGVRVREMYKKGEKEKEFRVISSELAGW